MGQGQSNLNVTVILAGDFHQCHIIILWMFLLAGEKIVYTIPNSYTRVHQNIKKLSEFQSNLLSCIYMKEDQKCKKKLFLGRFPLLATIL